LEDDNYLDNSFIIFCTKRGVIKKTPLRAFSRPRSNGIIAITIQGGDELLEVNLTDGNANIMLGTSYGMAVRFNEQDVRSMGRVSTGVRGIRLSGQADDEVVGMVTVIDPATANILTVSEKGFGKRSNLDTYRLVKRGGKGVKAMSLKDHKCANQRDEQLLHNKWFWYKKF
jgi:DNA gyrase subunit A